MLDWETSQLEQDRNEALNFLNQREEEQRAKLIPEINSLTEFIEEVNKETQDCEDKILKEEKIAEDQETAIEQLTSDIEKLKQDQQDKTLEINKARSEPLRFAKNADILDKAIVGMEGDLGRVQADLESVNGQISKMCSERSKLEEELQSLQTEIENCNSENEKLSNEKDRINREKLMVSNSKKELGDQNNELATESEQLKRALKRESDNSQELTKVLYELKKDYKHIDQYARQISSQLKDIESQVKEAEEKRESLLHDQNRQKDIIEKLEEEKDILEKASKDKTEFENEKESILRDTVEEIKKTEKKAQNKRTKEGKLLKEMEWLSLKREYMARKASQNITQAKETEEELKINELMLIDLKKKKQETDFKLKSYIAMYDEVKNARNKYVKLIQNSSQELAETKERIKILQNEVEILRNESSEKDSKLKEEKHKTQINLNKRDNIRSEINKIDYTVKQKESYVTQQVNEINKLNVIISTLEKEMIEIKQKYEVVCESRNYTGIQLIDRNDELCILYEKANIQETIQSKGENHIRQKEDEIRMLNIELAEVTRQIEVVRKQIPDVPKYASQVTSLKEELDNMKAQEKALASELEDPSNSKRFRELPGEDPDEEALEAKIQVLEERLNNKKEQLLEKELVLEEITALADKLRTEALTGRQSTLELAEKVNSFQARIKNLTRKMMATVSELSMFQATASKLQQEKENLEETVDSAQERVKSGKPPTETCEVELERMQAHQRIREEQKQTRLEQEEEERALIEGIQSTAKPRISSYIPDDGMGLPKYYGANAPFHPTPLGSTMRHIKKPQPKTIEI